MSYSIYESITSNQRFPVNLFVTAIQSSAFHWHNEYELLGVLKGSVSMRVQSEQFTLRKGDLYLVNPNTIHALKQTEQEENLCMVIQIGQELFSSGRDDRSEIRFYLDSTQDEEPECGFSLFYRSMARLIREATSESRHSPFRIRALICTLIADLFDNAVYDIRFRDTLAGDSQELAVKLIEFLEAHLREEGIVELACRQFGLSRRSLDRSLKSTVGVTAKELIESLRVEQAKNLLKNTEKNMNYILDTCGFGSEKTFYRVFRKETGVTPSVFRQKGYIENYNDTIKGYLDYEASEVASILKQILEGDDHV
ncbi:MAG: AraC family transcriptional regulator [Eubacteriales bacterium]|nr:AraC family transcriptional regulator [Eubacteriales bacterium]